MIEKQENIVYDHEKRMEEKIGNVYRHVKYRIYSYRVTPYMIVCPNISHNTYVKCLGSLYLRIIMYRVNHSSLFNSFQVVVILIRLAI